MAGALDLGTMPAVLEADRGGIRLYCWAALNLRRGPGLALTKDNSFVITIEDADGAAVALGRILTPR